MLNQRTECVLLPGILFKKKLNKASTKWKED